MFVAITGTIGAGKSSVSKLIAKRGFATYDTDKMVHTYYEKKGVLYEPVLQLLGRSILNEDGSISREKMAPLLFSDKAKLDTLEAMVFKQVKNDLTTLKAERFAELVFVEVPLLFESQLDSMFDCIIVVDAPIAIRLARLQAKGIAMDDALKRMSHQASPEEKRAGADYIIDNNHDLAYLEEAVDEVLNLIALERAKSWINPNIQ